MSAGLFYALLLSAGLISLSILLVLVRLVHGPSLPDRVVALDMMTVLIVAVCGLASLVFEERAFLDVALALALVGFLATVALARFAERAPERRRRERDGEADAKKEPTP